VPVAKGVCRKIDREGGGQRKKVRKVAKKDRKIALLSFFRGAIKKRQKNSKKKTEK